MKTFKLGHLILLFSLALTSACQDLPKSTKSLENQEETSAILSDVIIGEDNRKRTINHPSELGRSTGLIMARDEDGQTFSCTGTILSEKFVLTAAHCVVDLKTRKSLIDIYFIPRTLYKNQMIYGRFPADEVYLPKGYLSYAEGTLESIERDIALIKFHSNAKGENLMEKTEGKIGFWGQEELHSKIVTTIGYPGDKRDWTPYREENCEVEKLNEYLHLTSCDVYVGQSGSAIAIYSEEYKKSYVHGVISGENKAHQANFVTMITPLRHDMIMKIATRDFEDISQSNEEEWIRLPSYVSRGVNVMVKNDCRNRRTLYGMLNYRNESGEEVHKLTEIKPGHTVNLGLVPNKRYKIGVKIDNGNQASFTSKPLAVTYDYVEEGRFDLYEYQFNSSGDGLLVIDDCY